MPSSRAFSFIPTIIAVSFLLFSAVELNKRSDSKNLIKYENETELDDSINQMKAIDAGIFNQGFNW